MNYCRCCGSALFTVLTLLTMGALVVLSIAAVVLCKVKKLDNISNNAFIILIVLVVLSLLIFFFGLYASCCGKECAKTLLGIFYLVFALLIVSIGIYTQTSTNSILDKCKYIWDNDDWKEERNEIEREFNCNTFQTCKDKVKDFLDADGLYVYIGIYTFAALLIIGVVYALYLACCKKDDDEGIMYTGNRGYYTRY